MTNGVQARAALRNSGAAIRGEAATPRLRAIPVTPAAAERSSGATIAIVYDWRVGTSIWLMLKRTRSTAAASGSVGMNVTSRSRTFDGKWLKTIVRINPNRRASGPVARADRPASRFEQSRPLVGIVHTAELPAHLE